MFDAAMLGDMAQAPLPAQDEAAIKQLFESQQAS